MAVMPWHRLIDWFTGKRPAPLGRPMPMTLVTLSAITPMAIDEFEFYGDAEYAALLEWARMGRFILALSATERDEPCCAYRHRKKCASKSKCCRWSRPGWRALTSGWLCRCG